MSKESKTLKIKTNSEKKLIDGVVAVVIEPENFGSEENPSFKYENLTFIAISKSEEKIKSIQKYADDMIKTFFENKEEFVKKYLHDNCDTINDLINFYTLLLVTTTKGDISKEIIYDDEKKYYAIYYTTRCLEEDKMEFVVDGVDELLAREEQIDEEIVEELREEDTITGKCSYCGRFGKLYPVKDGSFQCDDCVFGKRMVE